MNKIQMNYCDPRQLCPAEWNPNRVDAINFQKLVNSLREQPFFRPVTVRELEDGTLQIVGGEHRTRAAIELGINEIPIVNLGKISDKKAKQIMLIDNERYGQEDADKMSALLNSDMGDISELLSFLPYDEAHLDGYFSHDTDIGNIDFDALDDEPEIDLNAPPPIKTHQIIRFKVPIPDAARIAELIQRTQHAFGFELEDDLTNAGDALVHLLLGDPDEP